MAGIQAGGALFPLEISDKNKERSLPSPFFLLPDRIWVWGRRHAGPTGWGAVGNPPAAGPRVSLGLGALWHLPGTGVAPGLSGYTVQPFKGC